MQFESTIVVNVQPENIFNIYSHVEHWSEWDPDTISAHIHGDFTPNTVIDLQPQTGGHVKIRIVEVTNNQSFITESRLVFCAIRFEHLLQPLEEQTLVTHRMIFSGLFKLFFYFILGNQLKKALPQTLSALKQFAEHGLIDCGDSKIK
ncbi:MAG: hypothetical protein F6K50_45760 [Moorea sp. SIO3I7]|uniref:SRPBCC family protein n=1 Tax=Moorena sp. SIO3I8 TaxID=2607833 RepID=UPI0013C0D5B9|nr:SRPBCC family protein [Moorena sp. SIO3I8]NEO02402.1 hypothetical protein [Moorena sp. SIO3I7]NEO10580.1 hypothetical protein [Moorena sp. SIO3I8]